MLQGRTFEMRRAAWTLLFLFAVCHSVSAIVQLQPDESVDDSSDATDYGFLKDDDFWEYYMGSDDSESNDNDATDHGFLYDDLFWDIILGSDDSDSNDNDSEMNREKRAAGALHIIGRPVLKGILAVKRILNGAMEVEPVTAVREFVKRGNYDKALKDFQKTRAGAVEFIEGPNGAMGRMGTIGDRKIILKKKGEEGNPTLEVIKTVDLNGQKSGRITEKITYKP